MRLRTVAVWVLGFAGVGWGQDTRTVTEPVIPPTCVVLDASLRALEDHIAGEDEGKLDTKRIQAAIDGCKPGMAVELRPLNGNNAFLTGPLEMRSGVTLLVDEGVTLYGSRDAALYDMTGEGVTPGLCGTIATEKQTAFPAAPGGSEVKGGCRPLISVNGATDVGIMGDGVIDGRGYAQILHKGYSWWQMARKAEPGNQRYYTPKMIVADHANGLVLYRITLHNSTNFHVSVKDTNGFTAWEVHLQTPTNKNLGAGNDARNTDGIDPGASENITVAHSWIDSGDDNIAIKTGVSHMSVLDNHFYNGHGMSIGSETYSGQSYLLVDGLAEDHTTSGIRIKSNVTRGGSVHDLVYRNVCMRGVKNPIAISPYYTNQTVEGFEDPGYTGNRIPDYKAIRIENMIATTPGDVLIAGLDEAHRTEVSLDYVVVEGITQAEVHGRFATVTLGPHGSNLDFSGTEVKVVPPHGVRGVVQPATFNCDAKFVPMH